VGKQPVFIVRIIPTRKYTVWEDAGLLNVIAVDTTGFEIYRVIQKE
jgi:hypothetical protein